MADIEVEMAKFLERCTEIATKKIDDAKSQAVHDIASEILRLSSKMVPFDKGMLLNSGNVIDEPEQSVVGYNKVYASRLHENPQYNFKNGRAGKFLETPIKLNLTIFAEYYKKMVTDALT